MKYLFIIQGEGRGHLTQAISLRDKLIWNGHEVSNAIIGKNSQREIPDFFYKKIKTNITALDSPYFITDKKNKKINITKSILINLFYIRRYLKSIREIHKIIKTEKPDAIINFYDLLGGLYSIIYRPSIPYFCIGHQYLVFHPEFPFPKGHKIDKFLLKLNTKITSLRANKLLALSFRNIDDIPRKKLYVVPPLLRKEIPKLKTQNEDYILGYILKQGYAEDIIKWHKEHSNIKVHIFWDKKDTSEETVFNKNLVFHKINDIKFLDYMSKCKAYISTAGFESICEAMYLEKPIMMIPTKGHFEQKCNAIDAVVSNAGIYHSEFDLSKLMDYIPKHKTNNQIFKNWFDSATGLFLLHLTSKDCSLEKNEVLSHFNFISIHNNL